MENALGDTLETERRGCGIAKEDFSLAKNFALPGEGRKLQIGANAGNAFSAALSVVAVSIASNERGGPEIDDAPSTPRSKSWVGSTPLSGWRELDSVARVKIEVIPNRLRYRA
jgi:hypothetical protein